MIAIVMIILGIVGLTFLIMYLVRCYYNQNIKHLVFTIFMIKQESILLLKSYLYGVEKSSFSKPQPLTVTHYQHDNFSRQEKVESFITCLS